MVDLVVLDGAAQRFNPASLPGLVLFLDPGRETGYGDGDPILPRDWSGLGNDTTQPTASARPAYKTNAFPSGRPGILGDGVDDHLITNAAAALTAGAVAVYGVARRSWTSVGAYRAIFSTTTYRGTTAAADGVALVLTAGSAAAGWQQGDAFMLGDGFSGGHAPRAIGANNAPADGTTHVFSAVLSAAQARIWRDGVQLSTREESPAAVPSISEALYLLCTYGGTANDFFDGTLGPLLIYATEHGDAERGRLQRWLGGWAGVGVA